MWRGARNNNLDDQPILLINIFGDVVRFVVSVLLNDPFCWFGEVLRNNNLYQQPILLLSITYTCRKGIASESTFCVLRNNNLSQKAISLISITYTATKGISSESTFCVVCTECWFWAQHRLWHIIGTAELTQPSFYFSAQINEMKSTFFLFFYFFFILTFLLTKNNSRTLR